MQQPYIPGGPGMAPGMGPPMVPAQPPPGCPPGLQYLTMVDQLVVKQKVEVLEAFTGFETKNKYKVFNSLGQQVYYAKVLSWRCLYVLILLNTSGGHGLSHQAVLRSCQALRHEHHGHAGPGGHPPQQASQVPGLLLPLLSPGA